MTVRLRPGETALFIATAAVVAALVHLIVVLFMPAVATRDAFARLARGNGTVSSTAQARARGLSPTPIPP